jgi:hypothetical protein
MRGDDMHDRWTRGCIVTLGLAAALAWGCRRDASETESPNDAAPGDSPVDGDPEDPVVPVDDAGEAGAPDGTNMGEGEAEECTEEHAAMGHCRREVTTEPVPAPQ